MNWFWKVLRPAGTVLLETNTPSCQTRLLESAAAVEWARPKRAIPISIPRLVILVLLATSDSKALSTDQIDYLLASGGPIAWWSASCAAGRCASWRRVPRRSCVAPGGVAEAWAAAREWGSRRWRWAGRAPG